jgi:type II secretory pathway component PulM
MKHGMKTRLAAGLTAGAMMLSLTGPAMAQVNAPVQANAGNLIAVLNNVNAPITDVQVVNVEDSVNNNTVNVNALQNFLNRNNVDVDIRNVLNDANVEILNNLVTIQGITVEDNTLVIFV